MNASKTAATLCAAMLLATGTAVASDYETIRFYSKNSKPEKLNAYAFSPDGRYLAMSFDRRVGSRSGVSVIDLQKQELLYQVGSFSFFTMAFSGDSQTLLGIGGYAGVDQLDLRTRRLRDLRTTDPVGRVGLKLAEKNGKIVVDQVFSESNPTLGDQVRVGDELLALNEGQKPERYNDRREWQPLVGKPLKKALEMVSGAPGSWVQLRLARRGSSKPEEAEVQRRWEGTRPELPSSGESYVRSRSKRALTFRSADNPNATAHISLRDLPMKGQQALSPDGKRFAMLGQVVNGKPYGVEVHSLATGVLERSTVLMASNYRQVRFSSDSKQLLVGTRDTVEVYDIESNRWAPPVVLTPREEVDSGRVVTRRTPLGFGFPGDLFMSTREVVFSKPAALVLFDVGPNGVLAVGSETGEVILASLESRGRVGVIGNELLGAKPEMVEFSPDGGHLVAYARGELFLIPLTEEDLQAPPVASPDKPKEAGPKELSRSGQPQSVAEDFSKPEIGIATNDSHLTSRDGKVRYFRVPDGAQLELSGVADGRYQAVLDVGGKKQRGWIAVADVRREGPLAVATPIEQEPKPAPSSKPSPVVDAVVPAEKPKSFADVKPVFAVGEGIEPVSLDLSVGGRYVAVVDATHDGVVLNAETGRAVLNLGEGVLEAAFTRTGDRVTVATLHGVKQLDIPGVEPIAADAEPLGGRGLLGYRAGLQNESGQMLLWEVESAKSYATLRPSKIDISRSVVAPNGRRWAAVGKLRGSRVGVELADLPKGQVTARSELEGKSLFGMAFSLDGKQVLIAQREGVLVLKSDWGDEVTRLTDDTVVARGEPESRRRSTPVTNILPSVERGIDGGSRRPKLPTSYLSVAAGPNGWVYCGGGDGVLRIWDGTTGKVLARLDASFFGRGLAAIDVLSTDRSGRRLSLAAGRDVVLLDLTDVSATPEPANSAAAFDF